ncbi:hypothetical protein BVRB_5g105060 [Beta vulgaris subsp. vulgaris]|nr:hypothetical protein BVRB_5g105060 [Beta vulgaris subsp. vulgaris]
MANPMDLNTNIVGIYTATTRKITEPRFSHKILLDNDDDHHYGILQKRMHIILCYQKQSNEDSGWHLGGWIKESLGHALVDNPILAGRLRKSESDQGSLEIVSNDSGVRCVEAELPLSLVDFLQLKEKNNEIEDKLVYWNDVDGSYPQFSPLFYIQVTNFQCGGYSVGISYNLFLVDPLSMAEFLNRWTEIHRSMAYESEVPKPPFFHTVNFKQNECSSSLKHSISSSLTSKTMIFNIFTDEKLHSGNETCKYFVLLCLEEAESKFGSKIGKINSTFTLIIKEPNGNTKVENLSKQRNFTLPKDLGYDLNSVSWEDLSINYEVVFHRENAPIDASHWIACDSLEGVVLVVISSPSEGKSGIKVYITVPIDQRI